MKKNVYEILDEFVAMPTRQDKINVLRFNRSYELDCVLRGAFDPRIKYLVEKVPAWKEVATPPGMGYSTIHAELDRVYLFEENHPKRPNLSMKRATEILIQMLESLEPREAKIFAGMLEKNLKVPGLDYKIVKEAIPDLLL